MKKQTWHRAIYWAVILGFGLLLTGKAVACPFPSAMEMGQDKAMDCCTDFCRMETSREAAQAACDQSRLAFSPKETLSSPDKPCKHTTGTFLTEINPPPLFSFARIAPLYPIQLMQNKVLLLRQHQSAEIYTSVKNFLI